jgi:PAS domain S-box-containing protein
MALTDKIASERASGHGCRRLSIAILCRRLAAALQRSAGSQAAQNSEQTAIIDALRYSESRFRDLAEISSEWFWEQDAELRYTWFSDTVNRPGLSFDLIGRKRWDFVTEGVTEEEWAAHKARLARREPFRDFRYVASGADGVRHHISVSGKPSFDADGKFCGYRGAGREITGEVLATEALRTASAQADDARAEAERLRCLAEEANRHLLEAQRVGRLGHWIVEQASHAVTWSPQIFEIAGIDPVPQLSAKRAEAAVHPDDRETFIATLRRAKATCQTLTLEQRWARPNGEIRYVQMVISAQYNDAGTCTHLFGTAQDITERKLAEEALKAAQEQLLDAIESMSDGFALFDRDDRYVMTNSNYRRFYPGRADLFEPGTRYEDMLRGSIERGRDVGPEDPEAWVRRLVTAHQTCGEPTEQLFLPEGRWIRMTERRTKNGGIVAIRTDITERKRAEEAAKIAQDQLSDAIEAMSEGFALFDRDDRYVMTNSNYRRFYPGRSDLFAQGTRYEDMLRASIARGRNLGGEDSETWVRRMVQYHQAGSEPLDQKGPDGRWIRQVERRTSDGGIVAIRTDITEQVMAQNALRAALSEAQAASLAKSQFLANMSHELRTPLNAIVGFSEMIKLAFMGPLPAVYQEYGRLIHQSGEHLHAVINDILDLAKVDAGKFELRREEGVDPRQIAEACVTLVRGHAEAAQIELSLTADDRLPPLIADPTRLKQILLNVLSNAIKFTKPGGSVGLTLSCDDSGGVVFEVCDTGPGMTAAEIRIALEPFGQVKDGAFSTQEGTGLGLPLARRFAELHGGSLRIDSEKGHGTAVTVILPARPVAASTHSRGPSPSFMPDRPSSRRRYQNPARR